LDLAKFKEDLAAALSRPEEWKTGRFQVIPFLIHARTGVAIYAEGQVYSPTPYYKICTTPLEAVTRCWSAVREQEREAECKSANSGSEAFLNSFPGFRR